MVVRITSPVGLSEGLPAADSMVIDVGYHSRWFKVANLAFCRFSLGLNDNVGLLRRKEWRDGYGLGGDDDEDCDEKLCARLSRDFPL